MQALASRCMIMVAANFLADLSPVYYQYLFHDYRLTLNASDQVPSTPPIPIKNMHVY